MEFLVFVIYGVVMAEWIYNTPFKKSGTVTKGREHYKSHGMLNMIVGMVGLLLFNIYLRDKDIIPLWSFWTGFIGFAIVMFTGMGYIIKMITTERL